MNSQSTVPDQDVWGETVEAEPEDSTEPFGEKVADFLRLCWLRRKTFVCIVLFGMLLSLLYALLSPNTYTSTTTLMPPDNSSPYSSMMSLLNSSSGYANLGSAALGLGTPGELFVSILGSRNVQDGLIARFDLIHYYHSRLPEDARARLIGATSIDEDRKSGVISISVIDHDPVLAAKLAKGYVDELDRVVTDGSTSAARRERLFLEERLKEVKRDLDASSTALSQFSTKSKAFDISSQAKSMVDAGLRLESDLIEGQSQVAALRQTYSEDNYRVKAAEARNAELQRQLDAMGGKSNTAKPTESGSIYPSVSALPALGLTYNDLERKVRVDEALWETLTKQYETAKVEEAKEIPTVRVLDVAQIPNRKTGPVRKNIMAVGTLLSILFAFGFVFARNRWNGIDPSSEPKKLLTEIAGSLKWRRRRSRSQTDKSQLLATHQDNNAQLDAQHSRNPPSLSPR